MTPARAAPMSIFMKSDTGVGIAETLDSWDGWSTRRQRLCGPKSEATFVRRRTELGVTGNAYRS